MLTAAESTVRATLGANTFPDPNQCLARMGRWRRL